MSKKFILNKVGQKHYYNDLVTLIQGLDENEVIDVLYALGLDELVDPNGGLAPYLSADIVSSEERFLNPAVQHNITLTGKLYNFFREDSERAESWRWTRDSGNPTEDAAWFRDTKEIVITDADLTDSVRKGKVFFTLSVKVGDEYFTDVIDFSTVISLNSVQIQASHSLFLGGTPSEISLQANVSEGIYAESYKWYVNDVLKAATRTYKLPSSIIENGKVANIRLEVLDAKGKLYTDFISIPKINNGSQGEPGVPGPPGADGKAKYTWIKYADDDLGTEMSEYPVKQDGTFREYMGVAANKDTPIESLNYADYTWSKYIGEDGIPGENGYMWVVYSQFPEGINSAGKVEVSQDPYDEIKGEWMVYLGLAYNKETITEPNFNGMTETEFRAVDFYWSKIKGEDGHTGYVFDLSNEMHAIPTNSDGKTPSPVAYEGAFTEAYLYYGNDIVPIDDYTIQVEAPFGLVFTQSAITTQGNKFTVTNVDQMEDSGVITIKAFSKESTPKLLSSATFSIVKVKSAPAYKIVPDAASIRVVPGVGGAADTLTPTSIKVKVLKNNGYVVEETTTGTLTYKYNYQTGDGTPLGINTVLQLSNAGNPTYIQFLYFDTATGMLADLESVPFVRDGKTGDPGAPGTNGNTTEFRYRKSANEATTPSLDNTETNPSGWDVLPPSLNSGEALWMTKAVKTSTGVLVGTWSPPVRLSGAAGIPGDRGPSPRMFEYVVGYTYVNNSEYRDYVLYRSPDPTYEGWYVPTGKTAVANAGIPDPAIFTKQPFASSGQFGTLIAEGANIGGLIMRNQQLKSQAETDGKPNILIDGKNGIAEFIGAKLKNSTFSSGESGTQRIEITSAKNAMEFYLDGKSNPSITVAASDNASGGNNALENPVVETRGVAKGSSTSTSFMSNSGFFSNGSNMYFWSASSGGPDNSACVVGLYQDNDNDSDPYNASGTIRAGVVGRHYYEKNEGKTFGGYFSSILTGGQYQEFENMPTPNATYTGRVGCSLYICTANSGTTTFRLPLMATLASGGTWNRYMVGFIIDVVMYNDATDVKIVSQNGATSIYLGNRNVGEITFLNSGVMRMLWNGMQWIPLFTKNFGM